jgi:Zn-dependent protease
MNLDSIIWLVVLVFSVVLHELGHGYAALKLGDPTADRMGRLTLNPLPHIDLFTTIILPLMLYLSGGPILGGAKPVPVQPHLFIHASQRRGMMLVAAAGPLVNFILAGLGLTCLHYLPESLSPTIFYTAFITTLLNTILGIFNLLPFPPLDGSKVLAGLLPRKTAESYMQIERFGLFLLLGVLLTGIYKPFIHLGYGIVTALLPDNLPTLLGQQNHLFH